MGSTTIAGIYPGWRKNSEFDTYRIAIRPPSGKQIWIDPSVHPTLGQLNSYLRSEKLKREEAEQNEHVQTLIRRLHQELASEHGLKHYKARERLDLQRKSFNYEQSLDLFFQRKSIEISIAAEYVSSLKRIWIPFFLEKGAEHPKTWHEWKKHADIHLHSLKRENGGGLYSAESKVKIASALNQYLQFLLWNEDLTKADLFELRSTITLEQKKRTASVKRKQVYSLDEITEIRRKIDEKYQDDLEMKLRGYGMLVGIITGLRKGNLLGLRAKNLHPDADTPHFETEDNIVSGWGRGVRGKVTLKFSTKTIVGTVKLPLLLPSVAFASEVCRFLKEHIPAEDYILKCNPHTVGRWWDDMAAECGFRALNPHAWRHGYATHGAAHLHDWYGGNPYFLQKCCTHEDFKTTQKYIDQTGDSFLAAFKAAQVTPKQF